jgi:heterotetrameric sarcosine oxidase beta subunit
VSGPKTVIIGGGIVGLSLAWNLAKKGFTDITVLERDHLNAGASARCGGGVRAQWSTADNIRIMRRNLDLFESFPQDTGFNNWYRRSGYLFLAYTEQQAAQFEKNVTLQHEHGVKSELLSPSQIKRRNPELNTEGVHVGAFHQRDGVCFPFAMVWGYTKVCRSLGVRVLPFHEATGLKIVGDRIAAVETDHGEFAADLVVNCAAAWAPEIGRMCDVELPNHPEKHEAIVTEALHPFLGPNLVPMDSGMYVTQTMRGELYACVGLEKSPATDYDSTFAFMRKVSRLMVELIPRLAGVKVLRQWGGFYDITPDTNPIIGYVDRPANFYQYHGLMGHGFMFAPALSEMIAEHLAGGKLHEDIAAYDLGRFERGGLEVEQMIIG